VVREPINLVIYIVQTVYRGKDSSV